MYSKKRRRGRGFFFLLRGRGLVDRDKGRMRLHFRCAAADDKVPAVVKGRFGRFHLNASKSMTTTAGDGRDDDAADAAAAAAA